LLASEEPTIEGEHDVGQVDEFLERWVEELRMDPAVIAAAGQPYFEQRVEELPRPLSSTRSQLPRTGGIEMVTKTR
jgi:hypothetical protein